MGKYTELKEALRFERKDLYRKIKNNEEQNDKYRKIKKILDGIQSNDSNDLDYDKVMQLKKYFPYLEGVFNDLKKMLYYRDLVSQKKTLYDFDFDGYINDLIKCSNLYDVPPRYIIDNVSKYAKIVEKVRNSEKLDNEELTILLGKKGNNNFLLHANLLATCHFISLYILAEISEQLDEERKDDNLVFDKEKIDYRINLINKYNQKFTENNLLSKFTEEDLNEFMELIRTLWDDDKCVKVLNDIKLDQSSLDINNEIITFDNLDMSRFNLDEIAIIEEIREIYNDEDLKDDTYVFENVDINYNDRLTAYKKVSIKYIIQDIKNLLNNIYDKKDEVISILKLIIDIYQKYTIRTIRQERLIELSKISDDLENIVDFINRSFELRKDYYEEQLLLTSYVKSINTEYIPVVKDLIGSDFFEDNYFDSNLEELISKYKNVIKKWKKKMSLFYQNNDDKLDVKENTDNLVLCINSDIDLSCNGYRKEFLGTIEALENKSSQELKMRSGRKGMSRIRKSKENNKEQDFVEYLENKKKIHLHFVPYRYSSDSYYRTGLIKFKISPIVKEYLQEKYGLSKQCACYGIFQIISAVRADHDEYKKLEEYILENALWIEEIAKEFSNDEPNFEKINAIVDGFLSIKKKNVEEINEALNNNLVK